MFIVVFYVIKARFLLVIKGQFTQCESECKYEYNHLVLLQLYKLEKIEKVGN